MEQLIGVAVQLDPDMNQADLQRLSKLSMLHSEILDSFIKGEITPDEYLELLAEHEVCMDDYCNQVSRNLEQVGVSL